MTYHRMLDRFGPSRPLPAGGDRGHLASPASIASALPLGTEHEATVPLFSLWTLWDPDRVPHNFFRLWERSHLPSARRNLHLLGADAPARGHPLASLVDGCSASRDPHLAILGTLTCTSLATRSWLNRCQPPPEKGFSLREGTALVSAPSEDDVRPSENSLAPSAEGGGEPVTGWNRPNSRDGRLAERNEWPVDPYGRLAERNE